MKQQRRLSQRKKKKLLFIAFLALILVFVVVTVGTFSNPAVNSLNNIETEAVTRQTIEISTQGSGVVHPSKTFAVEIPYDSTVVEFKKKNGDVVEQGEVIAQMSSDGLPNYLSQLSKELSDVDQQLEMQASKDATTIYANISGRVKRIHGKKGDLVTQVLASKPGLMEIAADGRLKISFEPQKKVSVGETVTVKFDKNTVDGTIVSLQKDKAVVTIPDAASYNIDASSTIYNKKKEIVGTGELKSNRPFYVTGQSGKIKDVLVKKNDSVSRQTKLYSLSDVKYTGTYSELLAQRNQLSKNIHEARVYQSNLQIVAPASGIVSDLNTQGQLPKGSLLCQIIDQERYFVQVEIDEIDLPHLALGQPATVEFDAHPGKVFESTVSRISQIATAPSSMGTGTRSGVATFSVEVELADNEGVNPNMNVTVTIVLDQSENALIVPIDALQTIGADTYVTIVTQEGSKPTFNTMKVEVGLVNARFAELLSGVSEGDKIQIARKSKEDPSTPFRMEESSDRSAE